tara:strand:+ start:3783 stop:4466 length:684 start_codon:yes stop_codon:yes gene_type:complete
MEKYPEVATERFDKANFHINYCLSFFRKFIKGDILEVGAGCGSFTKYYAKKFNSLTLTELDKKNFLDLEKKFSKTENINILNSAVEAIDRNFDTIMYLHVLEHIKNDEEELKKAINKLNSNGYLIIMAPAHQKIYSNLDRAVGHFRRYEKEFFSKELFGLKREKFISLDSIGYFLYLLNKIFFKEEVYPSKLKIFLWDKIFTPITSIVDFLLMYKFGKCFLAIYKKS